MAGHWPVTYFAIRPATNRKLSDQPAGQMLADGSPNSYKGRITKNTNIRDVQNVEFIPLAIDTIVDGYHRTGPYKC